MPKPGSYSVCFGMGLVAASALFLTNWRTQGTLAEAGTTVANEIRIVDERGKTAMILSGSMLHGEPGAGITMFDREGNKRLDLGLDRFGFCLEYDPPEGKAGFRMRSTVNGGCGLYLAKGDTQSQLGVEIGSDGKFSIEAFEGMEYVWRPIER